MIACVGLLAEGAAARPNTHGPAISTWDSRASNVVFGYRRALFGRSESSVLSGNANFVSTSGVLSAQFGLHYITYKRDSDEPLARGVSAGGVALFSFPLDERYSNGVPRAAFGFYLGGVPTALVSGRLNFVSVPGVLGVGLPWSPSPSVTLSPWLELSPGLNFDTEIRAVSTQEAVDAALDGTLTEAEVEDLVRQGLNAELKSSLGVRAGLSTAFHLGEGVDLDADVVIGGGALTFGASLIFRWDDMVPGVRARDAALDAEGCEAIVAQARACRASQRRALPARPLPARAQQPRPLPSTPPRPAAGGTIRRPLTPSATRRAPAAPGARPQRAPAPAPTPQPKLRPRPKAPAQPAPTTPTPQLNDALPPLKAAPPIN